MTAEPQDGGSTRGAILDRPHQRRASRSQSNRGPSVCLRAAGLASLALLAACAVPLIANRAASGGGVTGPGSPAPGVASGEGGSNAAPSPGPALGTWGGLDVHGTLSSRLRYRNAGGNTDTDLGAVLALEVGDRERDPYTGYFLGRVSADLDGDRSSDSVFHSLSDTYDHGLNGHIYEAYVDANRIDGLEQARLGRQSLYDTPEFVTFDGLLAVTAPRWEQGAQVGAYVGRPYHVYESSPSGDEVAGVFVQARPWRGGRVRLDFMHLEDELQMGSENNDLAGASIWQTFQPGDDQVQVRGSFNTLEGETRDARLAATWYEPENDVLVQAEVSELMQEQNRLVTELDPFFVALREYVPYRQGRLFVSKGIGEDYVVDAGLDVRRLADGGDEGPFNHEFERYHVTGTVKDVGMEGVSVAVTGEVWQDEQAENHTWGVDVTRDVDEALRLSAGTYYALFKDEFFLEEEREDVRTYYLRARIKCTHATTWTVGYELEDADVDTFHTVTARMTWRF